MDTDVLVAPVAEEIRRAATTVEAEGAISQSLMDRLVEVGLFSIYTPHEFGGLEMGLPDALRVVEEVSRHDGSTGWTVALGFANDFFACVLPAESAAQVLQSGSALIAGSPGFTTRAVSVDGGYRLAGQWSFCSGIRNATWVGVATPVFDGDEPRIGPTGPEMIFAFLPPADVEIVGTWDVTGLRGTGSHEIRIDDVFVATEMTGGIGAASGPLPARDSVLAKIPFMTALAVVQAPAVSLGIARRAVDEFHDLAAGKEGPVSGRLSEQAPAQVGLARAEALLGAARAYFYGAVDDLWQTVVCDRPVSLEQRSTARLAAMTAVENSCEAVDTVRRLAGATAIFARSPLERCWRDVHTAAQHVQVQDGRWETTGRVLFGLEPNSPFV